MQEDNENNKLTMEQMAKELGLSPSILKPTEPKQNRRGPTKGNFNSQRFLLFGTPIINIYLQGVHPVENTWTNQDFLSCGIVGLNGHPFNRDNPDKAQAYLTFLQQNKTKLFCAEHRDLHLEFVTSIAQEGIVLNKDKCLSKATLEKTIANYLEELSTFLVNSGWSNPQDYLESKMTRTKDALFTASDLDSIEQDF